MVVRDQHQFHARSALGVRQEILAQAIYIGIARFLLTAAAQHADADYHALSIKSAVLALAAYMTRLCLDDPQAALVWLPRLLERIARTRDKRRPGRSCPSRPGAAAKGCGRRCRDDQRSPRPLCCWRTAPTPRASESTSHRECSRGATICGVGDPRRSFKPGPRWGPNGRRGA